MKDDLAPNGHNRSLLLKVTLEFALHKPEVTMEMKVRSTHLQSTAVEYKNSEVLTEHLTAPDVFLLHYEQGVWKVQRQVLHPIPTTLSPNPYRSQSSQAASSRFPLKMVPLSSAAVTSDSMRFLSTTDPSVHCD